MGAEALLGTLTEGVGHGLIALDTQLLVREWNRWMAIQTRTPRDEAKGRYLCDLYPSLRDRGMEQRMLQVMREGSAQLLSPAFHHYLIPIDSEISGSAATRPMAQYCRLLPVQEQGQTTGLLILIEDYTERIAFEKSLELANTELAAERHQLLLAMESLKQVYEELREAQAELIAAAKLKALVETAGAAGHEMGQPLSVILGNIELALIDTNPNDEHYLSLSEALKAAKAMSALLDKIRSLRRYETKVYLPGTDIVDFDQSAK
jgi:signal transduction histidine kinase